MNCIRYSALVIFLLSICFIARAQNIIPNPSFEITTGCPTQINQVSLATGWSSWGITPDYFNACSNSTHPNYGVPFNVRGYQQPHSGQAYIGLFTYSDPFPNSREFVGCQLNQPLLIGQEYFVSMWVCAVEQFLSTHASNKLGLRFSTVPYSQANNDTASNNGHVFSAAIISDTASWTLIAGSFIADSNYQYVGIGNYFDDANTAVDSSVSHPTSNYAYYLIDDICVSTSSKDCIGATAIDNIKGDDYIQVYPNPANTFVYFDGLNDGLPAKISVYDIHGKNVFDSTMNAGQKKLELSFLSAGYYIIQVVQESESPKLSYLLVDHSQ